LGRVDFNSLHCCGRAATCAVHSRCHGLRRRRARATAARVAAKGTPAHSSPKEVGVGAHGGGCGQPRQQSMAAPSGPRRRPDALLGWGRAAVPVELRASGGAGASVPVPHCRPLIAPNPLQVHRLIPPPLLGAVDSNLIRLLVLPGGGHLTVATVGAPRRPRTR
jgi:hypothetical protein